MASTTNETLVEEARTPIIQKILKEIVEFRGWELIFQILLFAFCAWGIYNLRILYIFHTSPEFANIPKYSMYDFKMSLLMVIVFLAYKHFCQFAFFNFFKERLSHEKYPTEEERAAKAKMVCLWAGSIIYYSASSLSAFFLFKDMDFFPKSLGGAGESANMFKTLPAARAIPYGIEFYMIQFGNHLHTLIDYVVYKRKDTKFWEMFLHHSLAVFLIFFSFATNNIAVGIMVLFVHDPCDVFFYCNRILSDLKYKVLPLKAICYLVFLYCWCFFRLYAFPICIIATAFEYVPKTGFIYQPSMFMSLMLSALVLLHLYWFIFIIRAGVVMVFKKGGNYNVYDKKKSGEGKSS